MNYFCEPHIPNCKSKEYEKFIRSKPCLICERRPAQLHHVDRARHNAARSIPLCFTHHLGGMEGSYHNRAYSKFTERAEFEKLYKINLDHVCLNLLAEFLDQQ